MKKLISIFVTTFALAAFSLGALAQPGPPDGVPIGPPENAGPPDNSEDGPPGGVRRGPPDDLPAPPGPDPDFLPPGLERSVEARSRGQSAPRPDFRPDLRGGPSGLAGLSSIARLVFTPRVVEDDNDPIDPLAGDIVDDDEGPWGLLIYRWISPEFDYVFNAHELIEGDEHTLAYLPQSLEENGEDPVFFLDYPGNGVICLGSGTVNEEGDLHLEGILDIETDLPAEGDANEDEAVLALVVSADVNCEEGEMTAWMPADYLFGVRGMFYVRDEMPEEDD